MVDVTTNCTGVLRMFLVLHLLDEDGGAGKILHTMCFSSSPFLLYQCLGKGYCTSQAALIQSCLLGLFCYCGASGFGTCHWRWLWIDPRGIIWFCAHPASLRFCFPTRFGVFCSGTRSESSAVENTSQILATEIFNGLRLDTLNTWSTTSRLRS